LNYKDTLLWSRSKVKGAKQECKPKGTKPKV